MKATFKLQKNKGFTIIETLVAITILMIAIVGPLTIAHRSLLAAVYAHDQMTASYLAQDLMEYMKNVKANMVAIDPDHWLQTVDACTSSSPCSADTLAGDPESASAGISACSLSDGTCVVYKSDIGYNHNNTQTRTQFSRYFYLTNISADEAKIVVKVVWQNGAITNEALYESELFKVSL